MTDKEENTVLRSALRDIGDLADETLQRDSAILDRVALRDIVFRCADALAPDAELGPSDDQAA